MRTVTIGALLLGSLVFVPSTGANAQTCDSLAARCRAECPAAVEIGAPPGCTCEQRHADCKVSKFWRSWRNDGRGIHVRG
jgi:hypothetical protein